MKKLLILLIRGYQKLISPLKPACCKFYPSCSRYAVEAISKFGVIRGMILAVWRLLRCNPWALGGLDYVPETFYLVPFQGGNRVKPGSSSETEESYRADGTDLK